jgi:hypothetical protein
MLASVLKRYPELTEDDVMIVDRGEGPFIYQWNSQQPMPTPEELQQWSEEEVFPPVQTPEEELLLLKEKQELMQQAIDDLILGGML